MTRKSHTHTHTHTHRHLQDCVWAWPPANNNVICSQSSPSFLSNGEVIDQLRLQDKSLGNKKDSKSFFFLKTLGVCHSGSLALFQWRTFYIVCSRLYTLLCKLLWWVWVKAVSDKYSIREMEMCLKMSSCCIFFYLKKSCSLVSLNRNTLYSHYILWSTVKSTPIPEQ